MKTFKIAVTICIPILLGCPTLASSAFSSIGDDTSKLGYKHHSVKEKYRIDSTQITFFGNGTVQTSIDAPSKLPASAGLGVGYIRKYKPNTWPLWKLEMDININIGSNADTINASLGSSTNITNQSDFGTSILLPIVSRQSAYFNARAYLVDPWINGVITGLRFSFSANNRFWSLENSTIKATMASARIGVFHDFIPTEKRDRMAIQLGLNYAYNGISGDIGQKLNQQFRDRILNTTKRDFHGFEAGLDLRFNNLRFSAAYPILWNKEGEVQGLTNGRLITTVTFIGGFEIK